MTRGLLPAFRHEGLRSFRVAGDPCGALVRMQKRFRNTKGGHAAEVWVELGRLQRSVELYEDGELAACKRGLRRRSEDIEEHVVNPIYTTIYLVE